MTEEKNEFTTLSDGEELSFGGIDIVIKNDPSVTNTTRFCTSQMKIKGKTFSGPEIIKLRAVLQSFSGNKMSGDTTYKITEDVSAEMVKKGNKYMLRFVDQEIGYAIALLDKVYSIYLLGIIQAILSRLPVFVFYKKTD